MRGDAGLLTAAPAKPPGALDPGVSLWLQLSTGAAGGATGGAMPATLSAFQRLVLCRASPPRHAALRTLVTENTTRKPTKSFVQE
jgi:hypothetical protein